MAKNDVVDVDEVGLVHLPRKQEQANQANVPMEAGKNQLDSMYDRYQKKIYLFDRSWSMESGMAPEDEIRTYIWSDDTLAGFRKSIADDLEARVLTGELDAIEAQDTALDLKDDDKLKKYVIEHKLHRVEGQEPPRDHSYSRQTERKIEAVRGAMKRFVEKRFRQYPDAQVGMVGFGSGSRWMCYPGAPKPEVLIAVDSLASDMGGTDITQPMKLALGEFKRRPSHVGSHHIVMVTDAEAYMEPQQAKDFLHQMKELSVVFDFIYIRGEDEGSRYAETNPDSVLATLKRMCKETGGEYVEVSKSSDFEQKFFAASERKALPPAREVK